MTKFKHGDLVEHVLGGPILYVLHQYPPMKDMEMPNHWVVRFVDKENRFQTTTLDERELVLSVENGR